jgi:hypothetical protein
MLKVKILKTRKQLCLNRIAEIDKDYNIPESDERLFSFSLKGIRSRYHCQKKLPCLLDDEVVYFLGVK